jgi:predicted AlkP superfamily pyrophosphatase or phosphodiesterase
MGRSFPHPIQSLKALEASPIMADVIVEMAKAALDAERLGQDEVPDLLSVSFSNIDYVYHLYGPYSWEMQDALVRLDRSLSELLAAAEKAAGGKENLLVVLTADHGGAAIPEEWVAKGLPAARVELSRLQDGLKKYLEARFGTSPDLGIVELDVYLDQKKMAGRKVDPVEVRRAAAAWLSRQPSVAFAVARDDLDTGEDHGDLRRAIRLGYYPVRSGDVFFVPRQYNVITYAKTGTSHGSPWPYDNLVPLVLAGHGVRPGRYAGEIRAVDVAPTVSTLLEIDPLTSAEGVARSEAIRH